MIRTTGGVPTVESPCVRECCLDDADECIGCGRTLDEIKAWHGADVGARIAILEAAKSRREARKMRFGEHTRNTRS